VTKEYLEGYSGLQNSTDSVLSLLVDIVRSLLEEMDDYMREQEDSAAVNSPISVPGDFISPVAIPSISPPREPAPNLTGKSRLLRIGNIFRKGKGK
jgi:hypothetical protein